MSELEGISYGLVIPEVLMLAGLIAMILVPNLGDAKMRLPLTSIRIPVLLGGTRFKITSDPRIPNSIAIASFASSLAASAYMLLDGVTGDIGSVMRVDEFSSLMSVIFSSSLLLATIATMHRLPSSPAAKAPSDGDGEEKAAGKIKALYDNRRQVDFHILLLMAGLGMSLMAKSTHLFMLFVCLELASLSSYVLVGFHKESEVGGEAGMKYFIVGSVASAVGIYGMSLLYLWNGDLSISALSSSWDATDPFAVTGVSLMLVAFGFKVGAAPFHLAIPDAYSGAPSSVAGLLATASKAMGFVALMRVLLSVTMPAAGEAFWFTVIAAISVITMTWGNLAALSSDNPKRILAYSSVAHAGYMLAALAALGAGALGTDSSSLVITAVLFHLTILVLFKMGSFLVLTVIETQGGSHRLEGLHGLARRDPVLAASMFVFVLSLAGVPPFSGFLSKLLMINGIVSLTAGSGSLTASFILDWATSVDIAFWLAVAIVVNSALSLFYYLRMGMVMFFEIPEDTGKIPAPTPLRSAIAICAILTVVLGVGPLSEAAIDYVSRAAAAFLP